MQYIEFLMWLVRFTENSAPIFASRFTDVEIWVEVHNAVPHIYFDSGAVSSFQPLLKCDHCGFIPQYPGHHRNMGEVMRSAQWVFDAQPELATGDWDF